MEVCGFTPLELLVASQALIWYAKDSEEWKPGMIESSELRLEVVTRWVGILKTMCHELMSLVSWILTDGKYFSSM